MKVKTYRKRVLRETLRAIQLKSLEADDLEVISQWLSALAINAEFQHKGSHYIVRYIDDNFNSRAFKLSAGEWLVYPEDQSHIVYPLSDKKLNELYYHVQDDRWHIKNLNPLVEAIQFQAGVKSNIQKLIEFGMYDKVFSLIRRAKTIFPEYPAYATHASLIHLNTLYISGADDVFYSYEIINNTDWVIKHSDGKYSVLTDKLFKAYYYRDSSSLVSCFPAN